MYVLEKFVEFFLCVKQHSRHYVFSGEHTDTVPVHVVHMLVFLYFYVFIYSINE